MKKISIYGKGGIGKSTTAAAVASAMALMGLRVMQIGCDPKADSTSAHGIEQPETVLDRMRRGGDEPSLDEVVRIGKDGVICVECGGPIPGTGCAGRGIVTAFEFLKKHKAYEIYKPDVILYDVLGDVVCGGFAMPMRGEYSRNVFIVTSGEKMSLFAANNIALALEHFQSRGYSRLTGFIQNSRGIKDEKSLVAELAEEKGVPVVSVLPREEAIQRAEELGMTIVSAFPDSPAAERYMKLARDILDASDDV